MDECSIARFWAKVDVRGPDECWLWTAMTDRDGYGKFRHKSASSEGMGFAHRFSYFLAYGVIPNICRHTCDNPPCVNPAHLLNGTIKDNRYDCVKRGRARNQNANKTHCLRGHELSGENLYVQRHKLSPITGQYRLRRHCLACHRERERRYSHQRKSMASGNKP